ncbi:MAG: hypothetical protein IPK10_17095 [Bacteroidetes bacterium]|nr:hypothetical protein [Bacteroidota bacterium]
MNCLPNEISAFSANPPISSVPICDPFNMNNCSGYWNIRGSVFSDGNANCILDVGETVNKKVKVNLFENGTLVQQTYSNLNGMYCFNTDTGGFVISVDTIGNPFCS